MLPVHKGHVEDVEFGGEFKPGLNWKQLVKKYLRAIIAEENSRNLFGFLLLNLSFALVELFYGMFTNSLGLISDGFHMMFDCTALLAGLAATIIARWGPNDRYSFGYVRAEVIAGFCNALFLLFVAFFIFSEAIERAFEPPEVKHDRLFLISLLGFLVNLVGIFVFHHGGQHHHHHHGDHNHHHGDHHHHHHGHHHSHGHGSSQIMQGVFLHILADTLGSVGVIISSLLIEKYGLMISDPLCSMVIAGLIASSVYPLMKESLGTLMMRTPTSIEHYLPGCYQKVTQLSGVSRIYDPHFWTLCTGSYHGTVHIDVYSDSNIQAIISSTRSIFKQIGVTDMTIEVSLV